VLVLPLSIFSASSLLLISVWSLVESILSVTESILSVTLSGVTVTASSLKSSSPSSSSKTNGSVLGTLLSIPSLLWNTRVHSSQLKAFPPESI